MLSKFAVEYCVFPHRENRRFFHYSDDPVEVEDFLMHLLAIRARILSIRFNGTEMTKPQFDRMIKVAAERMASAMITESLEIDAEQIKDRFGFAA